MKIKCIKKKETSFFSDLTVGFLYTVYGISIGKDPNSTEYLLSINNDRPFWYPTDFFVVYSNLLPLRWYFKFYGDYKIQTPYGYAYSIYVISGYKELVFHELHIANLLEQEKKDLEIFYKRKKEIDEFESLIK